MVRVERTVKHGEQVAKRAKRIASSAEGLVLPSKQALAYKSEDSEEDYLYRAAAVETCRRLRGVVLPNAAIQPCAVRDTEGALVVAELFVTNFVAGRMHYEKTLGRFFKAVAMRAGRALTFEKIGKEIEMSKAGVYKLLQKLPYPAGGRSANKAKCQHCSRKTAKYGLCPIHYALALGIVSDGEAVLHMVEVLY